MEKKKYYVNVGSGEISQVKYDNNEEFVIHATDDEIIFLREKFNNMNDAGVRTFFRAHVPIMSYHNDQSNDSYDAGLQEAYQLLYELGDEQAKAHIKEMGILGDTHM
ncbi:hydrolase [Virgibacillus halodenitrificans]|uniref:hydrolase n=1 Tax=Virgibacillus halodenitrificans TaxID=1482 RepID=UPI0024C09431|nr:hydrolase [Virgibacillus halodenitrificans]WHX26911.1 hydrolase [Virgibacillus halodenitrificans]